MAANDVARGRKLDHQLAQPGNRDGKGRGEIDVKLFAVGFEILQDRGVCLSIHVAAFTGMVLLVCPFAELMANESSFSTLVKPLLLRFRRIKPARLENNLDRPILSV